jgi:hypothetical protein
MNRLSTERRAKVIAALVEGNSIRATCRMTGTAKGTVTRLLVDLGHACAEYQDRTLRNLRCERVQADGNLVLLLREGAQRPGRSQGGVRLRRRVDLDRHLRRLQVGVLLAHGPP